MDRSPLGPVVWLALSSIIVAALAAAPDPDPEAAEQTIAPPAAPSVGFDSGRGGALDPGLETGLDPGPDAGEVTCRPPWAPPVDAAVVDGFRLPDGPYGPGNRGLEYATTGGEPVSAVSAGVVSFAGSVGGAGFVVVDHPDGRRSTSAYLVSILVEVGQPVARAEVVGRAAAGFHLTARLDGVYVDPTPLLTGSCLVVRLVPVPTTRPP